MKVKVNQSELRKFLVKAKRNIYASLGENLEKVLEDRSRELIYENEDYIYRDRYFGFDPFIGQEIIFINGVPIWG